MKSSASRLNWRKIFANFKFTYLLLGINTFLFLVSSLASLIFGNIQTLVALGAESRSLILDGEIWRLITAGFLHANLIHFLFNMYALFNVGIIVERFFGAKKFFVTYWIGLLGAGLASLIGSIAISLISHDPTDSVSLGASGAIFALLGLLTANLIWRKHYSAELPLDRFQLGFIILMNLALGFFIPGIDNAAHLGGFITGFILGIILDPEPNFRNSLIRKIFVKIGVVVGIILLSLAFLFQIIWFSQFILTGLS